MRNKLATIWWVLRGRGVIYRANLNGGTPLFVNPDVSHPLLICESVFNGLPIPPATTGPYRDLEEDAI